MMRLLCGALIALSMGTGFVMTEKVDAAQRRPNGEPGWTYGVVRTGNEREEIKSLPVTARPYRPLHFYGNTVRRLHYRGTALPAPRDVVGASAATVLRQ